MAEYIESHRTTEELDLAQAKQCAEEKLKELLNSSSLVHIGVSVNPRETAEHGLARNKKYLMIVLSSPNKELIINLANELINLYKGQVDNNEPIDVDKYRYAKQPIYLFFAYDDNEI